MSASFTVTGLESLVTLVGLNRKFEMALEHAWHQSATGVIQLIRDQMRSTSLSGTGHSLPGNFPAIQSGVLSGSLSYTTQGWDGFEISAGAAHAGYLEYGTSRMAARPYLVRGIELSLGVIEQRAINNLRKALLI